MPRTGSSWVGQRVPGAEARRAWSRWPRSGAGRSPAGSLAAAGRAPAGAGRRGPRRPARPPPRKGAATAAVADTDRKARRSAMVHSGPPTPRCPRPSMSDVHTVHHQTEHGAWSTRIRSACRRSAQSVASAARNDWATVIGPGSSRSRTRRRSAVRPADQSGLGQQPQLLGDRLARDGQAIGRSVAVAGPFAANAARIARRVGSASAVQHRGRRGLRIGPAVEVIGVFAGRRCLVRKGSCRRSRTWPERAGDRDRSQPPGCHRSVTRSRR